MDYYTKNIRLKRGRWQRFENLQEVSSDCIHADRLGFIWTSGPTRLECFDGRHSRDILPELNIHGRFRKTGFSRDDRWWGLAEDGRLLSVNLRDRSVTDYTELLPDLSQAYWLWTTSVSDDVLIGMPGRIVRFNKEQVIFVDVPSNGDGLANGATISPRGEMWFTSDIGIHRYDGAAVHTTNMTDLPVNCQLWELIVSRDDVAWVATAESGLLRIDGNSCDILMGEFSMDEQAALPLLEDHAGNIWLTYRDISISCITPDGFIHFTTEDGISSPHALSATQDLQNKVWFCCADAGICVHDSESLIEVTPQCVNATCGTGDGAVYLATPAAGIMRYSNNAVEVINEEIRCGVRSNLSVVPRNSIMIQWGLQRKLSFIDDKTGQIQNRAPFSEYKYYAAICDRSGVIWAVTKTHLYRFDGHEMKTFSWTECGIKFPSRVRLFAASGGGILIGSPMEQGIWQFDGERFETFEPVPESKNICVSYIYEDTRGRVWLATMDRRILCCHEGRAAEVHLRSDEWSLKVNRMVEDSRGVLWFATNRGVLKHDGCVGQQLTAASSLPDNYVTGIDMLDHEDVLISTVRGVYRYHPDYETKPYVVISKVVTNVAHRYPQVVEADAGMPGMSIHFHGGSTKPGRLKYLYRMEGHDEVWKETWDSSVRYDGLTAGGYVFHVKAVDFDLVSSGEPCSFALTVAEDPDKTQIDQLSVELRSTREFSDKIIRSIKDAIIVLDAKGVITMTNDAAHSMLHYNERDIVGLRITDLLWPGDRDLLNEEGLKNVFARGTIKNLECDLVTAKEARVPVLLSLSVMGDSEGGVHGIVAVATDLTGYKELQQQLQRKQKMESLGVLAGGIAHDFNNLLGVIVGNAELVKSGLPAPSEPVECLDDVLNAAKHAAKLCSELLDYTGKAIVEEKEIDLSAQVAEIVHLLRASISKKITLSCTQEPSLPYVLAGDSQVAQIVLNLVTNAAEAIGDDAGAITVITRSAHLERDDLHSPYLKETPPPGNYVILEVADSGCGMDEHTKARICDPFFTSKFTGRGLGLAAVHGILHSLRGALQVKSAPGAGSTFTICLPVHNVQKPGPKPEAEPKLHKIKKFSGTVLIADDEATLLTISKRLLVNLGFSVVTAVNGLDALEKFEEHKDELSLVMLDITMPRMDGKEAYECIRKISRDIPVIMCSGYSEARFKQEFHDDSGVSFLHKPYGCDPLEAALGKALA